MKLKVKSLLMIGMLMVMTIFTLKAEPMDTMTVKMAAYNFFRSLSTDYNRSVAEPVIAYRAFEVRHNDEGEYEHDFYYIVNMGRKGFVILAADSRSYPVLAYSTTSSFDGQQLPPNIAYFLNEYKKQMVELERQHIEESLSVTAQWDAIRNQNRNQSRNVVVNPLITSKWAQSPYYNALCPADPRSASGHAVAGCTAVAMGQIIRYWRYPEHGTGSHSYVANNSVYDSDYGDYGTLTADYENTYYDYDNMPDSLTANSTAAEVNAVATLLYHCGVSLDMSYGANNSSSVYSLVDEALGDYFAYYSPIHVYRSVYTDDRWIEMMKNELNHLRPILYTGVGGSSVHAFVCDGYDDQGYFHFNWGWGGYLDGFFLLSNLNPNVSYNSAQTAVINVEIEPQSLVASEEEMTFFVDEGAPAEIQYFTVQTMNVDSVLSVSTTGSFSISTDGQNFVSQLVLPSVGGLVYVKYSPTLQQAHYELGHVAITSAACWDTVRLVGVTYYPECNPPRNLTAVQGDIDTDTNQVQLTWQRPILDVVYASWDSLQQSSFGDDAFYNILPMHRMSEADLLPLHKHRLTHIAFVADSMVTEYRLRVYTGGKITENGRILIPGTLIHEQRVDLSSLTLGAWNTVALDSAIVIDASRELWYGLYIAAPANSSAVITGASDCVKFKGNIYGYSYGGAIYWYPYNRNFVMKAVVDNPFVQYEVFRDGTLLGVMEEGTTYADYPPEYAHYIYEVRALWNDQCTEGVSQMVNFRPPCHVQPVTDVVTACDSYVWRDSVTYTVSGTYLYGFNNDDDCWQVDTLQLTIINSSAYTDMLVACDSLQWIDGVTYTESITGPEVVLTNAAGCDSVITLHLVILHSANEVDSIVVCDSLTWWDGVTYTESVYGPTYTFTDVAGCENATLTLNLTILSSSSSEETVYACDSYTWKNGVTYTESTDEPKIFYTNSVGCDSVVTLHLTIFNSVHSIVEQEACDSYTWVNGVTYTESTNVPTISYTSSLGCDSIVNLHLNVKHSSSYTDMIHSQVPYTWIDGNTYSESIFGPTVVLVNSEGCDSVVTLNLEIEISVESYDAQYHISVYPNPSRDVVRIQLPQELSGAPVEAKLYDMYGRLLQQQMLQTENPMMDMSRYAQGLYLLQLYHKNQLVGTAKISKSIN